MTLEELKISEELKRDLEKNILDLKLDSAFKKIFSDESNKYYLAYLINYCTGFDISYVEKHLKYKNGFVAGKNLSKKTGETDILVEVDNKVINIEMNREVTESLIRKNKGYVSFLESQNVEKMTKNKYKSKYIIQINISTKPRIPGTNELLYEIVYMDRNLKVEDVYNNVIIYDINLDNLENEVYNKDEINEREKGLLIFIERNKEKLSKLFNGDSKMEEIIDNANGVNYLDDEIFALEYDREAFKEIVEKEAREQREKEGFERGMKRGMEEGLEKGMEKGEKNKAIEIAKNLLKNGMAKKDVSLNTNLSIEEVEKINMV